jgi:hypothetical protein
MKKAQTGVWLCKYEVLSSNLSHQERGRERERENSSNQVEKYTIIQQKG